MASDPAAPPPIRLEAGGRHRRAATATADLRISIGGEPVHLQISVPTDPVGVRELLPVFQGIADVVTSIAEQRVERTGEHVSCRKGCGACCRQLVPISGAEAHALARLVSRLPEPRRTAVQARFTAAVERLHGAGLLDQLRTHRPEAGAPLRLLGLAYFQQRVACPFLEDESCSIHRDRPLACREYLVTSPAAACADPSPETVRCVPLQARPSSALREVERGSADVPADWVPLVLALEHAATHSEDPPARAGPEIVDAFVGRLTGLGDAGR